MTGLWPVIGYKKVVQQHDLCIPGLPVTIITAQTLASFLRHLASFLYSWKYGRRDTIHFHSLWLLIDRRWNSVFFISKVAYLTGDSYASLAFIPSKLSCQCGNKIAETISAGMRLILEREQTIINVIYTKPPKYVDYIFLSKWAVHHLNCLIQCCSKTHEYPWVFFSTYHSLKENVNFLSTNVFLPGKCRKHKQMSPFDN